MGAALWEAEIWSSSRTAPAGMAQSQGKLEMARKGLAFVRWGSGQELGRGCVILSLFFSLIEYSGAPDLAPVGISKE